MKLGIYIGSFNPPHKGHIDIVNYLLNNKYIDKVLIVPTLSYWDKTNLATVEDRINMLKFYESNNIIIDTKNNKYIYTYELMRVLSSEYKDDELYLIIGADNIISFDKWKEYKELLNYKIIVMNRNNIDTYKYIERLGGNNFIVIDSYPYIDVSSTEIREGKKDNYIDSKVLEYIKKNNLYGR